MRIDPIAFEVFENLFVSVAEEMGVTLCRTSFSPNIKERLDYSCAIYDASGNTIAQGDHMPVHLGAMPLSVRAAIDHAPMQDGDVVVLNDPFRGGTHLPDITMVSPVFLGRGRRPAFYVANRAHHSDVGGMSPGSMPLAREIFQEGLIIPPVKLVQRGAIVDDVLAMILANVRTPDEREGDLTAQIAANRVAERRLREIVETHGARTVAAYAAAAQDHTERVLRATIAQIPDGDYVFEDRLDDDGFGPDPIAIRVRVRIAGDGAIVDFTGSDPQTTGGVNANFAITLSATLYAFRCLVREDVLYNAGIGRVVEVVAPAGTIVNAVRPSAVAGGNVETSQRIVDVLLGALGLAAASQGTMNNLLFGDAAFGYYETICGGSGATASAGGADAVHTHMTNTRLTDPEIIERRYPVRVREFRIRHGSGGAGKHRGGDGVVRLFEFLRPLEISILSQRRGPHAPYGLSGASPGALGSNALNRADGRIEALPALVHVFVQPGDVLTIETPGGGGWGNES
jgi:N-methylhydantoinase B/oxoprolinase/acetone carboxylase alpha subunit